MRNIDGCRALPRPHEKENTSHLQSLKYYLLYRASMGLPSLAPGTGAHRDCPDPHAILIPPFR